MSIPYKNNANSLSAMVWEVAVREGKSFQQVYKYFEYGESMWYAFVRSQPKAFREQTQTIKHKR